MKICSLVILAGALVSPVAACDICSIYSATHARGEVGKGFFVGVAEQFTHFGTLQDEGREVRNQGHQYMDSSVSQVLAGYNFTEQFGIQFTAPIIHRSFQRLEDGAIDRGTESGLGDVALTANFIPYQYEKRNFTFTWHLLGGIKFPTGSTDRLHEEVEEHEHEKGEKEGDEHGEESGVHGHDLTLGSGSFDGIVGTSLFGRSHRFFFTANAQYAIRTEGDFDYEFANDLTWAGGPGFFLALNDDYTVGLQMIVSGETKDRDEFRGEKAEDTGITTVFLGPQINFTWRDKLGVEAAIDLPVSIDNTALQIVPDYRVRAALTWHF